MINEKICYLIFLLPDFSLQHWISQIMSQLAPLMGDDLNLLLSFVELECVGSIL